MTQPTPDQQQLWTELHATMIKPLLAIACDPHEEPARRHLALQIAHEASPTVTLKALAGLATSTIDTLSRDRHQPPSYFLKKWIASSGKEND